MTALLPGLSLAEVEGGATRPPAPGCGPQAGSGSVLHEMAQQEEPGLSLGVVTEIAEQLFGVRLDVDADLLAEGFDSLDMTRLASRLERAFGIRPDIAELFDVATLRSIAACCQRLVEEQRGATSGSSEALATRPEGRAPSTRIGPARRRPNC